MLGVIRENGTCGFVPRSPWARSLKKGIVHRGGNGACLKEDSLRDSDEWLTRVALEVPLGLW